MNNPANIHTVLLSVPTEHPCYADHFPGSPVVPGALLLKWIFAQITQASSLHVSSIKQIKFLAVVLPGDQIRIEFSLDEPARQLSIDCYRDQILLVKGKAVYTNA